MHKVLASSIIVVGILVITSSFFQKYDLKKGVERGKVVSEIKYQPQLLHNR